MTREKKCQVIVDMSSTQKQSSIQVSRPSSQKPTGVSKGVLPLRTTVTQSRSQEYISREHFVMMTKFLQFNKMTRTGMKDFTERESKIYDRLIRMYNDLAKTNKRISTENLNKNISNVISV